MIVILDIGSSWTKCGFAGSSAPLSIIKTPLDVSKYLLCYKTNNVTVFNVLKIHLHHLFFSILLIDPSFAANLVKKVIILENTLSSTNELKKSLALILNHYFLINNLIFIPTHLASLYILGIGFSFLPITENKINKFTLTEEVNNYMIDCAVILDCGYSQITILPIYNGLPLLNSARECPAYYIKDYKESVSKIMEKNSAFCALLLKLQSLLNDLYNDVELPNFLNVSFEQSENSFKQNLKVNTDDIVKESNKDLEEKGDDAFEFFQNIEFVENLAVAICCVANLQRSHLFDSIYDSFDFSDITMDVTTMLKDIKLDGLLSKSGKTIIIPGWVREALPEMFFRPSIDGESIATLLYDSIINCPIDCRMALCNNIVLIGGTCMIPGFITRLDEELGRLSSLSNDYKNFPFLKERKIHSFGRKIAELNTDDVRKADSYFDFVAPEYAAWTGASILFASLYYDPKSSLALQPCQIFGKAESRLLGSKINYQRSKMLAVLNSRRGIISKYLPHEELTKIFGRSHKYHFKSHEAVDVLDKRELATDHITSNFEINLPNNKGQYGISGTNKNQEENFVIPDWDIIDPFIRPYGYISVKPPIKLSPCI